MNKKSPIFKKLMSQFLKNSSGQIALMFALLLVPLAALIGGALDFSQKVSYNSKLQQTLDAVSIGLAKSISKKANITDGELAGIAETIYNANMVHSDLVTINAYSITKTDNELILTQTGDFKTMFMQLVGVSTLTVVATSKVNIKRTDVELVLILDMSRSMIWNNKLQDLKVASKDLINILIKDDSPLESLKIGFVPWSVGVNVSNLNPKKVIKNNSSGKYKCAASRYGQVIDSDPIAKPMDIAFYKGVTSNGTHHKCPPTKITPLSDDKSLLLSEVDTWSGDSGTSSNAGLEWGWGVLSPKWKNFWQTSSKPKAYGSAKKFAILMSDGENNAPILDDRSIAICNAMKAKGIKIFSIAFKAPAKAKPMLKNCASDANSYIDASSGAALKKAFKNIADQVGSFYLSG